MNVVPAVAEHVPYIAALMREADRNEVMASHGVGPVRAAWASFRSSDRVWAALTPDTQVPFALFGVEHGGLTREYGRAWMLGTDDLPKWSIAFAKHSRHYVEQMLEVQPMLVNWVDERNKLAITWLKWLGAKFEEPKPYGVEGIPFRRFVLRG